MLDETSSQILVQDGVNLFLDQRVNSVRTRCDGGAAWWDRELEREQRTRTEIRGGARKYILVFAQNGPKLGDDFRSLTWAV